MTLVHSLNLYVLGLLTIHKSDSPVLMQCFVTFSVHGAFITRTHTVMAASTGDSVSSPSLTCGLDEFMSICQCMLDNPLYFSWATVCVNNVWSQKVSTFSSRKHIEVSQQLDQVSSFRFIACFVSTWNPHLHLFPLCLPAHHHICPFSSLVCNALCHSFTASWGCLSVYALVSSCFTVWTLVFAGICIFLRLETLNCSSLSLCESFSRTHPRRWPT